MDLFKVLVVLILGFLLYREFFNKKTNQIEKLDINTGAMEIKDNEIIFNKPVKFNGDVNANTNLYVGTGANRWHMRDTRLGITGKFDFVPGFTSGSSGPDDNWIRLLNYNNKNTGAYFTNGGLAADKAWFRSEIAANDIIANNKIRGFSFTGDRMHMVHLRYQNQATDVPANMNWRTYA
jgi:hypothetical protein